MTEAVYYLEYIIGAFALVLAFRVSVLLFDIHEEEDEINKKKAKHDYKKALKYYLEHPSDLKAKKECYEKGDKFYRFKIPDFFSYPLPDYDTHIEYLDHQKMREDLVTKDISEKMEIRKKAA